MQIQSEPAENRARQLVADKYALDTRPAALNILPP
jgi:hypothetical protein